MKKDKSECPQNCYGLVFAIGCPVDFHQFFDSNGRKKDCPFYADKKTFIQNRTNAILKNSTFWDEARTAAIAFAKDLGVYKGHEFDFVRTYMFRRKDFEEIKRKEGFE